MLRLSCLLFQVLVMLSGLRYGESSSATDVSLLSDNDFFSELAKAETNEKWFVMFFAPWCGHCKRLEPIWKDLSITLKEKDRKDIRLAQVNAEANHETTQRFGVKGYPTLLYLVNKEDMYKYDGARTVEDMMEFVFSGYHRQQAVPLPPPPSFLDLQRMKFFAWLQSQDSMLAKDFEHILSFRKNAAVVLLLMGGLLGFMLGCIASTLTSSGSPKSTSSKGNKQKPKAD